MSQVDGVRLRLLVVSGARIQSTKPTLLKAGRVPKVLRKHAGIEQVPPQGAFSAHLSSTA
jgi:hypothetical protein